MADESSTARSEFIWRTLSHFGISLVILGGSLLVGVLGYQYFEGMAFRDAFLNASMLVSGMGPVKTDLTDAGKIFAGVYAMYSGFVVIALAGLLLSPGVHHLMHHVHWDDPDE